MIVPLFICSFLSLRSPNHFRQHNGHSKKGRKTACSKLLTCFNRHLVAAADEVLQVDAPSVALPFLPSSQTASSSLFRLFVASISGHPARQPSTCLSFYVFFYYMTLSVRCCGSSLSSLLLCNVHIVALQFFFLRLSVSLNHLPLIADRERGTW